ncbi:sugar ABC transporter permease [Halorubrum californiense DSM 19288]|uniref:Sugar ABC transporter permease n=1 Tax=Halorubrum californiense DSM 19288 TaxID=1227465 RepID=M0EEC0_9EURY|nr:MULTISPECIES: ABC transporter permease [Halorubrum]ELZ44779.1 sugar ABC transporter permease [Halorubrum californiense DSM 19288]TKX71813.1 ABC transporter permease [Halorubrum sp. GN11GM_10-3_MGM]
MSAVRDATGGRSTVIGGFALLVAALLAFLIADIPGSDLVTIGAIERALQAATPIALAAIGGLYAEKSGVFNIGLEGFMIFGALFGAVTAWAVSGGDGIGQADLWLGVLAAVLVCGLLAALFAVLLIRYEADQIVAGLAVWFIGLGFGPFISTVVWGGVSSPSLPNIDNVVVPVLSEVPIAGRLFFDASPLVLFTILVAVGAWVVLFRTRFGYWVQAAGENPEALDTAGVDVNRVRYATLIFSGIMAGLGGAVLSIGIGSGFTGTGVTMVDGRGWIAIVAYLFGNYNPLGTYGASLLFGAMDMLQIQLQTIGISLPGSITGLFPYVAVLVVLVVVGYTRVPAAVGEPYTKED